MSIFPLSRSARIAVFASGRGSNLQSIADAFPPGDALGSVVLVISNNPEALALEIAKSRGIAAYAFPFPTRKRDPDGSGRRAFEAAAEAYVRRFGVDLICLAGFMRIFSPEFNSRWTGRMLNIHPSLLPDFQGLHPQTRALEAGVRVSGCTVHFVDAGVDTGPAILQRQVPVYPDDSVETLSKRILKEEHQAYPEAIRQVLTGKVHYPLEAIR